ncbi:hypothetical protein FGF61_23910 [Citrobacter freundii]|nr:hypothetical protein FGF61_23910 [Citrobacter freundii]
MARLSVFHKRCHGVSGVGGSNPLVPTKNPRKNNLRAGFLCLRFIIPEYYYGFQYRFYYLPMHKLG